MSAQHTDDDVQLKEIASPVVPLVALVTHFAPLSLDTSSSVALVEPFTAITLQKEPEHDTSATFFTFDGNDAINHC
jgi:hypothetical protein